LKNYAILCDVSLDPKRKIGMGAYIFLPAGYLDKPPNKIEKSFVYKNLNIKQFENTSSTQLEVETTLWAVAEATATLGNKEDYNIILYTDSQCVAGLPERRARLVSHNFCKRGTDIEIKNAKLYKQFYAMQDRAAFEVIKIRGHSSKSTHDTIQRIFSYVDSGVRYRFRKEAKNSAV
jgi:ribonuclease HI